MAGSNGRKVEPKRLDYNSLGKDALIALLKRRDAMTEQKVGLVWDQECLARDKALNDKFVVIDTVALHCGEGPYDNLVIEGDNYDSLRWLHMTHKRKVQCIYIDPPYNTGAASFCFADRFETSQWLEFLATRLRLAKDLLTDDGVILVSIDDTNRDLLKLLMDEIFPGMFRGSFVTKTREQTNSGAYHFFSRDHDHVLIYSHEGFAFTGRKKTYEMFSNHNNDPLGDWRSVPLTLGYDYLSSAAGTLFYPLEDPATENVYVCNPNRVWVYASETRMKAGTKVKTQTMEEFIRRGRIIWPKNPKITVWNTLEELYKAIDRKDVPHSGKAPLLYRGLPEEYLLQLVGRKIAWGSPSFKRYKTELRNDTQPVSSWIRPTPHKEDADTERCEMVASYNVEGTNVLRDILGSKKFNYPKPLSLLTDLIRQATKPDSTVLDFFAGSGTTAHAVLAVNAEDGGNRRFIMCSEQNCKDLCSTVLAERLRRVINGYADVQGTGGNFAYLRAATVPLEYVPLGTRMKASKLKDEQIWTLIQTIHGCSLQSNGKSIRHIVTNDEAIVYSPAGSPDDVEFVRSLLRRKLSVTLYTWNPPKFSQLKSRIAIHALPEAIIARFPTDA